jgi:hypothetical protein
MSHIIFSLLFFTFSFGLCHLKKDVRCYLLQIQKHQSIIDGMFFQSTINHVKATARDYFIHFTRGLFSMIPQRLSHRYFSRSVDIKFGLNPSDIIMILTIISLLR